MPDLTAKMHQVQLRLQWGRTPTPRW